MAKIVIIFSSEFFFICFCEFSAEQEQKRERKLRFEASMQMRAMNEARQRQWQVFREGEDQRRRDKASAEELCKLKEIVQDSRARREYTFSKLQHRLRVCFFLCHFVLL